MLKMLLETPLLATWALTPTITHCSNTHAVVECPRILCVLGRGLETKQLGFRSPALPIIRIDQEALPIVFLFVSKQWCTALCLLMGQDLALSRPLGARLRRYICLLCLPLSPTHGVFAWGGEVQIFSMWRRGQHWSVYMGVGEDVWVCMFWEGSAEHWLLMCGVDGERMMEWWRYEVCLSVIANLRAIFRMLPKRCWFWKWLLVIPFYIGDHVDADDVGNST